MALFELLLKAKEGLTLLTILTAVYSLVQSKFDSLKNNFDTKIDKLMEQHSNINVASASKLANLEEKIIQLTVTNSNLVQSLQKKKGITYFLSAYFLKPLYSLLLFIPKEVLVALIYVCAGLLVTIYLTYVFKTSFFYSVCASISCFVKDSVTLLMQKEATVTTKMLMEQAEQLQISLMLLSEHIKSLLTSNLLGTKDLIETASNAIQESLVSSNANSAESIKIGFKTVLEDLNVKDQVIKECLESLFKQNIKISEETVNIVVQTVTSSINKDLKNSTYFLLEKIAESNSHIPTVVSTSLINQVMESSSVNGFDFSEKVLMDLEPTQLANMLVDKYF